MSYEQDLKAAEATARISEALNKFRQRHPDADEQEMAKVLTSKYVSIPKHIEKDTEVLLEWLYNYVTSDLESEVKDPSMPHRLSDPTAQDNTPGASYRFGPSFSGYRLGPF